ncbi:unnamed protein product [Pylaiella littoralis]
MDIHDDHDDNEGAGYAWEKGFERTWEGVEEDEHGNIKAREDGRQGRNRRVRRRAGGEPIKRGMIRYLYLAIDLSKTMSEGDMRPSRLAVTLRIVQDFVTNYFDQNPLSQLGILVTREGRAEKITELSGNPKAHMEALTKDSDTKGEASLQNLLEMACTSLRAVPEYGNREVVVIYSSLSTCDPGDIHETIAKLKTHKVRASVVGLGAEMFVLRRLSEETSGDYSIAGDENHYRDSLMAQCTPPPTQPGREGAMFADLVRMGFPAETQNMFPSLGYSGNRQELSVSGYSCPRCKTKTSELPSECVICALPLVSSPHLARSYHHLFPVPQFDEISAATAAAAAAAAATAAGSTSENGAGNGSATGLVKAGGSIGSCAGCLRDLSEQARYQCPDCKGGFCLDCDMYVHDSLHNCPGCC